VSAPLGLLLAWLGLLLPWLRWTAEASGPGAIGGEGTISGFASSRPFWIVLGAVTVLVLVALWRRGGWPYAVLAGGALGLVAIGAREAVATLEQSSAYVSVLPGAGAGLSLLGAVVLLAAALVALRPHRWRLAGALAAVAAVVAVAAVWPAGDGRPADGAIADAADGEARALAFHDGTLYALGAATVTTRPTADRSYDALAVGQAEWIGDRDFLDYAASGLAFSGDELFVAIGGIDRLASVTPDGDARLLVSRPPRRGREPPIPPDEDPLVVDEFVAGPLAPAPGGGVYVLGASEVRLWRDGELTTVADGLEGPTAIAAAGARVYVADQGRVVRIEADGTMRTVVGTEADPGCVRAGRDDPLALDVRACTGARALAVDGAGNLYLALRGVATIAAVTPEGRMAVVAGEGPRGWGDGDGRAVQARFGNVTALAVGADGDLYVGERWPVDRVRRIAAPATLLDDPPAGPARRARAPGCDAIAALSREFLQAGQVLPSDRRGVSAAVAALDRGIAALEETAPDEIGDDVRERAAEFRDRAAALVEAGFDLAAVEWERRLDLYLGGFDMRPDAFGVSIGDYAEDECGLVGGFDVPVEEANAFCVAYRRSVDRHGLLLPSAGDEPTPEFVAVVRGAPAPVADIARAALDGLRQASGRSLPESEVARVGTRIEGVDSFASAACALL
jgi:hypothetical protein